MKRAQVRWAGHLVRKSDTCLPKRMFFGELAKGKNTQGGQKKHFKQSLSLSEELWHWPGLPGSPRTRPPYLVYKGTIYYEQNRTAEVQKKRELWKSIANPSSTKPSDYLCLTCARAFRVRIGHATPSKLPTWCPWSSLTTMDEKQYRLHTASGPV